MEIQNQVTRVSDQNVKRGNADALLFNVGTKWNYNNISKWETRKPRAHTHVYTCTHLTYFGVVQFG